MAPKVLSTPAATPPNGPAPADLELPTTAVITEAREHSDQPRQPPVDQAA